MKDPIVEGAYYEREDGQVLGPAVRDQGVWRVGLYLFFGDGAQLDQSHRLTRRVWPVYSDPAEVVAELRKRSTEEKCRLAHAPGTEHTYRSGRKQGFDQAADLVAEKLEVGRGD